MGRGWVISAAIVVLLAVGLAWSTLDAAVLPGPLRHLPLAHHGGSLLFLLAGLLGLAGSLSINLDYRRIVSALRQIADRTSADRQLSAPSRDLLELVQAVNDLLHGAQRAVDEAQLSVRETQIQLKVATAGRQHAEAILHSISDAVLVTDPFDELVLANESAAKAFDFQLSQAVRRPIDQVLRDGKLVELIREMRQSNSRGTPRIVEYQTGAGKTHRTLKATLCCVADRGEQSAGVVAVLHDITREKEVAQMKNDFVSSVSHELRTPLASIKAYVEMLIDGEADDDKTRTEFYEVIQNEANRLSRLIDNILNISRIESGLVKVNKQPQSLTVIAKQALEVILPQAKARNIRLEEQLTAVFYQTLADKDMLYQAVLNLLSNAVKYTPDGGTITVRTSVDEVRNKVIGSVSDTGVGIPPKDLPFVFDKFYRAEANNRLAKGSGLGLSLAKHIIETVHQGRIFVDSEVGRGSSFSFELELCR